MERPLSVMEQQAASAGAIPGAGRLGRKLREGLRSKLLRNILTVMTGTAGAQAVTMAFMPVITRLYGPEAYGVLGTFLSLALMLIPVAALTYPMALVLPRRDADARSLAKLSFCIAAGLAGLMTLALWLFGERLVTLLGIEVLAPYLLLLPLVMFSGAMLELAQQWLYRTQRFRVTASVAAVHSLLFNGMRSLAGLIQASVTVLIVTTALQQALHGLMLLGGMRWSARYPRPSSGEDDGEAPAGLRDMARRHYDFPVFRAPQMLINAFSQHLPTIVLAASFGPAPAGFFALCKQTLSMPTNLIGKSVADVYYPRLSQAIQRHESITWLLIKGVAGLALVGLVPFGLVVLAGPWLFAWVFGAEWAVAGEFARWLALAEYTIFLSRPCTVAVPALALQGRFLLFEVTSTGLRVAALLAGALWWQDALLTVQAFAAASMAIYLALVVIVLFASQRWHARVREVLAGAT